MLFIRPQVWLGKSSDEVSHMTNAEIMVANAASSKVKADLQEAIKTGVHDGIAEVINEIFGKKGGQTDGRG